MPRARRRGLGEAGLSTLEFALVAPILVGLIIGIVDFGTEVWDQLQISNAVQAGAAYASINGWNATAAQIENAVTSATSLSGLSATPAPVWGCGCSGTTTGITAATCGSTCADGTLAAHYVTISAQASFSTILPYPGIANPMTLAATAYARLYP